MDRSGKLHVLQERHFDYLVSLSRKPSGFMNVNEYRRGRTGEEEFPDHVATEGTPTLVLIFHPKYAPGFSMTCEGLGEWHGQPAWQLRFEERDRSRSMIAIVIGGRAFNLRIRGRAWILADSYQVARLETDLAETIPPIHLRLDHRALELCPRAFSEKQGGNLAARQNRTFHGFQRTPLLSSPHVHRFQSIFSESRSAIRGSR